MNVELMCRALSDLGFQVDLATYPFGRTEPIPGLTYHRVPGVPFVRQVPIGFSLAKIPLDILLAFRVRRLLERNRYVALHAVEEAAFFCAMLGRLASVPVIADLDSDIPEQLRTHPSLVARLLSSPAGIVERRALHASSCAVTVCRSLTRHVEAIAPGKPVFQIEDVPLPSQDRAPDAEVVERTRREMGLQGRRILLYAGNLEHYQGVDRLVAALPRVLNSHPEAALVVVGGEREQIESLKRQARDLGIEEALWLFGPREPESLPDLIGLAEVLVSPRLEGENTPMKIYSYMLSGKPIVATDLETHTQVLDGSTAILTPPDVEGLVAGIRRALENPGAASALGATARERVRKEYDFAGFREKLDQVYRFISRR